MGDCGRRAVAFVQHGGRATPACSAHVGDSLVLERITRLRRCGFEELARVLEPSAFELVIVEAIPRCSCGACAEFCVRCASRRELRPLARADRR